MRWDGKPLLTIFFVILQNQILNFTWILLYAFVFSLEFGWLSFKQRVRLLHHTEAWAAALHHCFCILFLKIILVNRNVREDDLFKICIYLRSYGIFDQADQERIFNDLVFCTPERKASELLTEIGKRGHHVYWHLAHALKTRQTPMFNFFHSGDFQCCGMYVQWYVQLVTNVKKTRVIKRVAHWSQVCYNVHFIILAKPSQNQANQILIKWLWLKSKFASNTAEVYAPIQLYWLSATKIPTDAKQTKTKTV